MPPGGPGRVHCYRRDIATGDGITLVLHSCRDAIALEHQGLSGCGPACWWLRHMSLQTAHGCRAALPHRGDIAAMEESDRHGEKRQHDRFRVALRTRTAATTCRPGREHGPHCREQVGDHRQPRRRYRLSMLIGLVVHKAIIGGDSAAANRLVRLRLVQHSRHYRGNIAAIIF